MKGYYWIDPHSYRALVSRNVTQPDGHVPSSNCYLVEAAQKLSDQEIV